MNKNLQEDILNTLETEPTFKQAVSELLENVIPHLESIDASSADFGLLRRMIVPERTIMFKVVWDDDSNVTQHNMGYRVQFNSALGPYKGGLRFDPSVNIDILKFLGFEQIFKNALTGLPLGGGKGGSDFDPKGKSDHEIKRFCVAFMTELIRHIGPTTDVPAGDIGVGEREIGYLYGTYKKISNRSDGALTGKGTSYNGSCIRTEATGFGTVYFIKEMLEDHVKGLKGMRAVISGSGNVATHVALKLIDETAIPLTLSDRGGYLYAKNGLTKEIVRDVQEHKVRRKSLKEFGERDGVTYNEGKPFTAVAADLYIPSATQYRILK